MADIQEFLTKAMAIDGAVGVALVELDSGMCLGTKGGGALDMELAGASATKIVQAKNGIMEQLELDGSPEEALLTMGDQYHLIRLLRENEDVFSYLILDEKQSSLAIARTQLRSLDRDLSLDGVTPADEED